MVSTSLNAVRYPLARRFWHGRWPDALLLLLALATRSWRLGYHSIWFDEAVSLRWAGSDLAFIWAKTFPLVEEKHPPVYYMALHLWQRLMGWVGLDHSDIALRLLGSLLGVLTVWGVLRLATASGTRLSGRLAGLLVALSPLLVWYSQELRMFQPATTGIVWCAYCLWRAWHSPRRGIRLLWWAGAVVAVEVALYSYLFSAFVLPAAGLMLIALWLRDRSGVSQRKPGGLGRLAEGAGALVLAGLLFLPLAANAWGVNAAESTPGRAFANFGANLLRLLQTDTVWRVAWPAPWLTAALICFGLLILLGLLLPWPRGHATHPFDRTLLWLWLGGPLLVANLLLSRSHSIFDEDRYLLFVAPFTLWAAGRGCAVAAAQAWRAGRGAAIAVGVITAVTAAALLAAALPPLWSPARARENWRAAARYVLAFQAASPGLPAAVVTHVDYTHQPLEWYLRQHVTQDELPVFFPFGGTLTPEDVDGAVAPPLLGIVDYGAATLWLTQSHLEGVDDAHVVEGWLSQHYPLVTEQYPAGIKLTGYMLQGRFAALPLLGPDALYPDAELAPGLRLAACEVLTPRLAAQDSALHPPSGWVHLRLWWHSTATLETDYVATAQMVGPEGVWGERLHRPSEALRLWPTSILQPGEYVRDEMDINLNPITPPGEYPVIVGAAGADGQPVRGTVECGRVTVE